MKRETNVTTWTKSSTHYGNGPITQPSICNVGVTCDQQIDDAKVLGLYYSASFAKLICPR